MTGDSTLSFSIQRVCGWWEQAGKLCGMGLGVQPEYK